MRRIIPLSLVLTLLGGCAGHYAFVHRDPGGNEVEQPAFDLARSTDPEPVGVAVLEVIPDDPRSPATLTVRLTLDATTTPNAVPVSVGFLSLQDARGRIWAGGPPPADGPDTVLLAAEVGARATGTWDFESPDPGDARDLDYVLVHVVYQLPGQDVHDEIRFDTRWVSHVTVDWASVGFNAAFGFGFGFDDDDHHHRHDDHHHHRKARPGRASPTLRRKSAPRSARPSRSAASKSRSRGARR